jgi:hypothetical protein
MAAETPRYFARQVTMQVISSRSREPSCIGGAAFRGTRSAK